MTRIKLENWEKQAIAEGPGIGLTTADTLAARPRSPSGRFICSLEHPMPPAATGRWEHIDVEVIGEQESGWPSGDLITNRCRHCGKTWREELPQ